MEQTKEVEEFDLARGVERRLLEADRCYDQSPADRLRALDIYAEFSLWIDPATEPGRGRVARILADPRPLDTRFRSLVALASNAAADEDLRLASMFAAVRWSLASDEYACADAALRRFANLCRQRGKVVPTAAHAAMCDVMTGQGRALEAVAVYRRLAGAVDERGDHQARLWNAKYRCGVLAAVEAWDEVLAAVRSFENLCRRGPLPPGIVMWNGPAYFAALAHLALGECDEARIRLESIDASVLSRTEAPRFLCLARALAADLELADGAMDEALAAARSVMQDGGASPSTWCAALTTALEIAARAGNAQEAREIAATLVDLLARSGDRIGAGASLGLLARAFRVFDKVPPAQGVLESARRTAVEDLSTCVSEITSFVRRDGGFSHVSPDDRRLLLVFRRRHAATLGPVLRSVESAFADPSFAARRRIDETVGDLSARRWCEACLRVWNDEEEPLPIGHVLGATLRSLPSPDVCPDCARR